MEDSQAIPFDSNQAESLITMGKLACYNIFLDEAKIKQINDLLFLW